MIKEGSFIKFTSVHIQKQWQEYWRVDRDYLVGIVHEIEGGEFEVMVVVSCFYDDIPFFRVQLEEILEEITPEEFRKESYELYDLRENAR